MALTTQQRLFAAGVAQGLPLGEAAVSAGYAASNAEAYGSRLAKKSHVAQEIERMRAKAEVVALGSKAELLNLTWQRIQAADNNRDFAQLARLWFDASGSMVHRQEISTNQQIDLAWSAPVQDDAEDEACE